MAAMVSPWALAICNDSARFVERALARAVVLTERGELIDDHQVVVDRVAYAATEQRALRALVDAAQVEPALSGRAAVAAALLGASLRERLRTVAPELGLSEPDLAWTADGAAALASCGAIDPVVQLGDEVIAAGGRLSWPLEETLAEVRQAARGFAEREVSPMADKLHREDGLVSDRLISEMAKLGFFGLSVPESLGGSAMGNLAMILITEELSRGSLAGGGSLITRPEILAKALLAGGTEAQQRRWLPSIAAGERMVAISVTEPNVGSDVASLTCRAQAGELDGQAGYYITGNKAWCTFAGRADLIALLARTDSDSSRGAKGLSLFVVEKPRFAGHEFETAQPHGGSLSGKADHTPGYRGMHSFTLAFDRWFVPAENLVGEAKGLGRGFYLQMAGFAAGRLQTGGRACGVAQAALEKTAEYVTARSQFGKPIGSFQLTRHHLGTMAAKLSAARALTYAAAIAMDADERTAAPLAAQAKLLACDVAVEVTQLGQLLHGGWGYAEEFAISRYVVDAQVLPIFEGVKPVLSLKVVGRALLSGT
ncbi:MAG: acyl-CoA/acyl-ACP dehydrogenase [Myxococcales bacterium]|nr:acyl-CoA/acyl-ACP dehydrogenase [Myxococcales bacterium]